MNDLIKIADRHFSDVEPIPSQSITLREEVRNLYAQNKCGQYNRS
jgi:hypothetical protein